MKMRPLEHSTDGKGNLCGAVFAGSPCACEIVGDGTLPHPLKIEYCAKHAAAPELLDIMVSIERYTHSDASPEVTLDLIRESAKGIIAKATT